MPRFLKGSPEAKAWGEKMKAARGAKKNPKTPKAVEKLTENMPSPSIAPESLKEDEEVRGCEEDNSERIVKKQEPAFMVDIIKGYFPDAGLKIEDRGNDYSVEITIKEGDIRAFVADKLTAKIEAENWCRKIKANIEGKPFNEVAGINLTVGIKEETKKLPQELGQDKEFFFRE